MNQLLRPVCDADIAHVARRMRPADVNECYASAGMPPELALLMSVAAAEEAYTMVSPDGERAGVCGISAGHGANDRMVWMLGTTVLERHPSTFLRHSRAWVDDKASRFLLWNWVDERNTLHIKWLRWLGARFHGSRVSPYTGTRLLHFTKVTLCA